MVVTSTDNPMNESGDGPMRLGDEGPAVTNTDNAAGTPDFGDEDDGGSESVAHFMADVFGEWLDEDDNKKEMKFQDLKTWAESVLGVDMGETELRLIFDHILEAGSSTGISMPSVTKWWQQDDVTEDTEECDFRRAIRLRGIFASCKTSLLALSDPTESHLAARRLFQRINVVCDFHREGRDRITMTNLRVLADDLGIAVDDEQLKQAINEMDPTKSANVFVSFHPFEQWWLHGAGMDEENAAEHVSTLIHSMLRLCGLLMCAQGGTVFGIWNSSTAILGSEEMRVSVEKALDKIARNADHHHFDHMIERLHVASLGGLLHRDDHVVLEGNSLNIFPPQSQFRMMCYRLCTSIQFELFILFCIFINVVGLVLYAKTTTSEEDTNSDNFFWWINLAVAIIFTLEMLARMVATGLITGRMAYLRLGWNVFDFIVVASIWMVWAGEWIGWIGEDSSVAFTLTAFRAFRTLRFFEGTRQIVATLGEAKGTLSLIVALMFVLFTMYAVMGREAFAGALTRTCEPFVPFNYTDLCTGELVVAAGGGHRRQLGGGATQGDLRDIFDMKTNHPCSDEGTCERDGFRSECWAQEKPLWYSETRTTSCPLTLECTIEEHGCYEIAPLPGPKWREHHIDKYGFDTMSTAALTIFQVTAKDEWMRIANPIMETNLTTSFFAWPFFMVVLVSMGLMCVNLFLASITLAYLDLQKDIRQENAIRQAHESLIAALLVQSGGEKAAGVLARLASTDGEMQPAEKLTGCRAACEGLVTGQKGLNFDLFIIGVVVLNTLSMAMESYRMEKTRADVLEICEIVFTIIYTFEAFVKIMGLGPKIYFAKGLNRLDFFIVCTAILGYIVEIYLRAIQEGEMTSAQTLAVLRTIRIFRVIRAARALRIGKVLFRSKAIAQILSMAFSSVSAILSLLYMIFLTLIVASISGVFLFDKCHQEDTEHHVWTRANYKHLGYAFLANFQLFTEDNWANIMFEYIECTDNYWMSIYFVMLFCSLNFILLVIFVSIFLDNFTLSEEGKRKKQIDLYVKSIGAEEKQLNLMDLKAVNMAVRLLYSGGGTLKRMRPNSNLRLDDRSWNPMRELPGTQIERIVDIDQQARAFAAKGRYGTSMEFMDLSQPEQAHIRGLAFELKLTLTEKTDALGHIEGLVLGIVNSSDISLGCMPKDHPLRQSMTSLVENSIFEHIILSAIFLSGLCLAYEGPYNKGEAGYDHSDTVHMLLVVSDMVFYTLFLVECTGKIIAYGFVDTPNAYLSTVTNCFDFSVVIITTIDVVLFVAMDEPPPWLNLIRLMRSLRLVRLLEHIDGLNIMAQAIWRSLPACTAVMGLLLGNMLVFSIVGMNLFTGQLWYCKYDKSLDHSPCECAGNGIMVDEYGKAQPHAEGVGPWTDEEGADFLIECMCSGNYIGKYCEYLNGTIVNGTMVYDPPVPNAVTSLYNPAYENSTSLMPLDSDEWKYAFGKYGPWKPNLFNYDNFGQSLSSLIVLTTRQGWHELFFYATDCTDPDLAPEKDSYIVIAGVFHVMFIMINGFMLEELFIGMLVEIFSQTSGTVLLTENQKKWRYLQMYVFHFSETHPDPPKGSALRSSCYRVVTHPNGPFQKAMIFVVVVNVLMLIYDDNAPVRRMEGQTAFDVFNDICVFIYTIEIVVESLAFGFSRYVKNNPYNPAIVVFQCLRVWKLFEVLSHFSSLKKLVHTLRLAVPQVKNVILLMLMVYFLFGIMAMKLYGNIDLDGDYELAWIGETNNFGNVQQAMKLLFQITTGNPLPLMVQDITYTAQLPWTVMPFVFIFFIMSNFIFLNVFIALLLENFEYNLEGEFAIEEVEVDQFKLDWDDSHYTRDDLGNGEETDPTTSAMELPIADLHAFMLDLKGPLSVVVETDPFWHNRLLLELDCDADDELDNVKTFHFHEVMLALVKMRFGNSCLPFELEIKADEKLQRRTQDTAARLIQMCVLSWKMGRNPPSHIVTEEDKKNWATTVSIARFWVMTVAIKKSRISANRLKTEIDLQKGMKRQSDAQRKAKKLGLSRVGSNTDDLENTDGNGDLET